MLGVHGSMLLYDITARESFNSIEYWTSEIGKQVPTHFPLLLVGTHSDQEAVRQVSYEEGLVGAVSHSYPYSI